MVPDFHATVSHNPMGSSCMCIIQLYIHLSADVHQLERLVILECMMIMLHVMNASWFIIITMFISQRQVHL